MANLIALTVGLPEKEIGKLLLRLAPEARVGEKILCARTRGKPAWEKLEAGPKIAPSRIFSLLRELPLEVVLFLEAQSGKETSRTAARLFFSRLPFRKIETDGNDLKKMGIPPGPVYKKILGYLLDLRMDGMVRSRKQELEWVRKYYSVIKILP